MSSQVPINAHVLLLLSKDDDLWEYIRKKCLKITYNFLSS